MADVVKNKARFFEQNASDPSAAPPLRKPPVANKPKPSAKPDAASTDKESEETNPFKIFGAKSSAQGGGVPVHGSKFRGGQNDSTPGRGLTNKNSPDSNNNKNTTSKEDSNDDGPPKKALFPPKCPSNTQNAEGSEKPAPKPKFPAHGSKPIITDKPKPPTPAKVPLLPKVGKIDVNKTDSVCSTSSNSSNSSISSPSPSASNVAKDKGKFDFSKNLRPVVPNGLPPKRTLNSLGSENSSSELSKSEPDPSSPSPPPLPKTAPPLPTSPSNSKLQHEDEPVFISDSKPNVNLIEQLSKLKPRGKSIEKDEEEAPVILRHSDGKKFRKITLDKSAHSASAPEKPTLPADIDLSTIRKEYDKAKEQPGEISSVAPSIKQEDKEPEDMEGKEETADETYVDAESMPAMRPKKEEPEASRVSERVSVIPDMSPEEEGAYDDTPADETYTQAVTDIPTIKEEPGETEQEKKRRKKEEEKERREREKQEREQEKQRKKKEEEKEKQRKKQEEEEAKRRKNFKLTGKEQPVGEGEIKDDAKGGNNNLKVRKGQKVTIVRIDNNPANKWLVKTDTHIGYVDSTNISVDPDIIRQAMTKDRKESAVEEEDDQPTYDAVPEDTSGGGSTPAIDEMEYEDVYEEL